MVCDAELVDAFADTVAAALVPDLNKAGRMLFNSSNAGGRLRAAKVNFLAEEFKKRFTTSEEKRFALYRFQSECMSDSLLRRVREEFRVQACELSVTQAVANPAAQRSSPSVDRPLNGSIVAQLSCGRSSMLVPDTMYGSCAEVAHALKQYSFITDNVVFPQLASLRPSLLTNFQLLQKTTPSVSYPVIKHQRLPFYRNVEVVVPPIQLRGLMSHKKAEYVKGAMRFMQQLNHPVTVNDAVSPNREMVIRFFRVDATEPQIDVMPPNISVEVAVPMLSTGGHSKTAVLLEPANVRFNKPKLKPAKPIVIPSEFAKEPCLDIILSYTPSESDHEFAVAVFRAQPATVDDEIAAMRQTIIEAEATKASLLRELKPKAANDDDEIGAAAVIRLSLKCPLSKSRIRVPCRSVNCAVQHVCDAYSFLEMNQQRPTWNCNMCKKAVFLSDLRFEPFIADLLTKFSAGGSDLVNIKLDEAGDDLLITQAQTACTSGNKTSAPATAEQNGDPQSLSAATRKRTRGETSMEAIDVSSGDDNDDANAAGSTSAAGTRQSKRRRLSNYMANKTTSHPRKSCVTRRPSGFRKSAATIVSDDDSDIQVLQMVDAARPPSMPLPTPSSISPVDAASADVVDDARMMSVPEMMQ